MVCGCSDGKLKGRKMWLEKKQQNLDRFINLSGLSLQIEAPFFFNGSFSYRFGWGGGWMEGGGRFAGMVAGLQPAGEQAEGSEGASLSEHKVFQPIRTLHGVT